MAETGIQWGGWSGHLRLGINVRWEDIGTYTTQSHVWADFYYGTSAWGYDSNETLSFAGSIGGSWAYHLYSPYASSVTTLIGTYDLGVQSTSFGGGPSWTLYAATSPAYNGDAPAVQVGFTLPARPPTTPDPPGTGVDSITATSARILVSAPAFDGGTGIDWYGAWVLTNNAWPGQGGNVIASASGGTFTAYGLSPATTYYYTAQAHNAVGYSGFAWMGVVTTSPTVPSAPGTPSASNINPDSVTLSWTAPGYNGGSALTGYAVQVSTSPGFETAITVWPGNVTSCTVTGLQPGMHYYARVEAFNAVGGGAWSGTGQFDTLSGAKVKVNGAWVTAKVYVKVNGAWVQAKVYKKVNGAWLI